MFLASATEQVLATGVSAGFGLEDDSHIIKVYNPKQPSLVLDQASVPEPDDQSHKLKLVGSAMAAVHIVAAMEAMSLGVKVGLEPHKLFDIIATAAGTSPMFTTRVPQLLSGKWTLDKSINDVIKELASTRTHFSRL